MKTNIKKIMKGEAGGGYALLFAVLVSAVVLGVGVSILNISRKEILLTSGAEQSQFAFYAADAGYECALYQDLDLGAFSTTSPASTVSCGPTYSGSTPPTPTIFASPVTVTAPTGSSQTYIYAFNVPVSQTGSCAAVTVSKTYTTVGASTDISTQVLSDGFNVGWEGVVSGVTYDDCAASNQTKVERALLANY